MAHIRSFARFSLVLSIAFCLLQCKSVNNLYEEGDYEKVIKRLNSKAIKGKLDAKERGTLKKSITKYLDAQAIAISSLSEKETSNSWDRAYDLLKELGSTQNDISRYTQFEHTSFSFINTEHWYDHFDQKYTDYLIDLFEQNISDYLSSHSRSHAMEAYAVAADLSQYARGRINIDSMKKISLDLGHRTIYYEVSDDFFGIYMRYNRPFNNIFYNDKWNTFTRSKKETVDASIHVSVDRLDEDKYEQVSYNSFSDRVIDSYEEVRDTSGNVERVPIYKNISAQVKTTTIDYKVRASVDITIEFHQHSHSDYRSNFDRESSERIQYNYLESGDREALPPGMDLEAIDMYSYDYDDLKAAVLEDIAQEFEYELERIEF